VWFLWRCGARGDRAYRTRFVVKCALGTGAGLLLAAPFLVSFAVGLSHEFVGHNEAIGGMTAMPRFAFPQLLLPYVYGPPLAYHDPSGALDSVWGFAGGFVSISIVMLAVLSLASSARRGLKLLLVLWLVIALAKVYGQPPILRHLLVLVPGGGQVLFYRYSFPAIGFAFAVLAALGIDGMTTEEVPRRRVLLVSATMFAIVVAAAYGAHRLSARIAGNNAHSAWMWAQIGWTIAVAAAISVLALRHSLRNRWRVLRPSTLSAAVLVLDVAVMFTLHELSAPRDVRMDLRPVTYLQQHLGRQRYFTLGPLGPNYGGYWRLASLNDIDTPLPSDWTSYVHQRLDNYVNPIFFVGNGGGGRPSTVPSPASELLTHLRSYRDAGVSYVLTAPRDRLPESPATFKLVLHTPVAWIYHLAGSSTYFTSAPGCALKASARDSVRVDCARPATLLRRELQFPGWRATIDGRAAPIRRGNGIFQRITLPSGRHQVVFSYWPPYFTLSIVGLAIGLGMLVLGAPPWRRWISRSSASATAL
jgi:Bacterial membrane protein YfhO